jgi:GNAT superfamily N-acetyltransferase
MQQPLASFSRLHGGPRRQGTGAPSLTATPGSQRSMEMGSWASSTWLGTATSTSSSLDTTVHPDWQRKGIGRRLVEEAIDACRGQGEWLHVDADEDLMTRLYQPTGFQPTPAGLIDLTQRR